MKNSIRILSIFAAVTIGSGVQAQTAAGQFRGDVIRTFEDAGNLVFSLENMDQHLDILSNELTETDTSPDQIASAARALNTEIDGLQNATAALFLFEDERAKRLAALSVKQVGNCDSHRDYGFALRMAKNALGRTLADFSGQQDELSSAIADISDQRLAVSEMQEMIGGLGVNNVKKELEDVMLSADIAYSNAQKSLVIVKSQVSHQRPAVEAAYAQLEKSLTNFRADQVNCVGEIARHKTS